MFATTKDSTCALTSASTSKRARHRALLQVGPQVRQQPESPRHPYQTSLGPLRLCGESYKPTCLPGFLCYPSLSMFQIHRSLSTQIIHGSQPAARQSTRVLKSQVAMLGSRRMLQARRLPLLIVLPRASSIIRILSIVILYSWYLKHFKKKIVLFQAGRGRFVRLA